MLNIFDEDFQLPECTLQSNIHIFESIVKPIKENWLGEKLSVYRYFESVIRYFGSLPCAICNSENSVFFEETENKDFQVFSSSLNCLDDVYNLELSLRLVHFLRKIIMFVDSTRCLLDGNDHYKSNIRGPNSEGVKTGYRKLEQNPQICQIVFVDQCLQRVPRMLQFLQLISDHLHR